VNLRASWVPRRFTANSKRVRVSAPTPKDERTQREAGPPFHAPSTQIRNIHPARNNSSARYRGCTRSARLRDRDGVRGARTDLRASPAAARASTAGAGRGSKSSRA
jgi:hypothetical protein